MPREFENGGFTLKTLQMFRDHATLGKLLKDTTITVHFGFACEQILGQENHVIIVTSSCFRDGLGL